MTKLWFMLLSTLIFSAPLAAQSQFEGTWKLDLASAQFSTKPDQYLLQNGMYKCKTCVPPIDVKADGSDQKVTGDPYSDTLAVKVVDDHNVEFTSKKGDKVVGTSKNSVSADGGMLTVAWTDNSQPQGGTQTGTFTEKRVAKGPAGAHLISGSWHAEKSEATDAALTWSYKLNGNELSMTNPTGQSFTAKLGGADAPFTGDPGVTSVSVKMIGKDTLEETHKRNGKVISISKMTVSADGKSAKNVYQDKLAGTTASAESHKM